MDCGKCKQVIDDLFYGETDRLNTDAEYHIQECTSCRSYYEESKASIDFIAGLKKQEPVLKEPEALADSIMHSVNRKVQETDRRLQPITLAIRMMAAAIIALFLTLGVEQYMVLSKVQQLESNMNTLPKEPSYSKNLISQAKLIDIGLLINSEKEKARLHKLSSFINNGSGNLNFTYGELQRYMEKKNMYNALLMKVRKKY